jgi:hypothetical protein
MERTEEHDPERLADELEQQTDELEQRSDKLDENTTDVRRDWERKRADPGVPGASPPEAYSSAEAEAKWPAKDPSEDTGAEPPGHTDDESSQ